MRDLLWNCRFFILFTRSQKDMGGDFYGNGNGKANLARNPHGHDVWGKMNHFRGVVVHHISPFEQRTFKGYFSVGAPKMLQRIRAQVFRMGIRKFFSGQKSWVPDLLSWNENFGQSINPAINQSINQ